MGKGDSSAVTDMCVGPVGNFGTPSRAGQPPSPVKPTSFISFLLESQASYSVQRARYSLSLVQYQVDVFKIMPVPPFLPDMSRSAAVSDYITSPLDPEDAIFVGAVSIKLII